LQALEEKILCFRNTDNKLGNTEKTQSMKTLRGGPKSENDAADALKFLASTEDLLLGSIVSGAALIGRRKGEQTSKLLTDSYVSTDVWGRGRVICLIRAQERGQDQEEGQATETKQPPARFCVNLREILRGRRGQEGKMGGGAPGEQRFLRGPAGKARCK